jgi:hypothetical protein
VLSTALKQGDGRKPWSGPVLLVVNSSLILVIVASYLMAFWAAYTSGLSWDEKFHLSQIEKVVAKKPFIDIYGDFNDKLEINDLDFVYGLTYQQLGHVANVLRGNETWSSVSTDAEAYAVRHFVGVLLSLIAGTAVFFSAWIVTRSRLTALFCWALIASWPNWLGHSFMNPKDLPAAAGWTVFSLGLAIFMSRFASKRQSRDGRQALLSLLVISLGFALAIGSRIAFWLPLLLIGLLATVMTRFFMGRRKNMSYVSNLMQNLESFVPLGGVFLGFIIFIFTHWHLVPYLGNIFVSSLRTSGSFDLVVFVLTYGQAIDVSETMPRTYLPLWFWATTASVMTLFLVIGIVAYLRIFWLRFRESWIREVVPPAPTRSDFDPLPMTPFVLQAFLLPAAVVVVGSPTWDGQRHHLYALPALALIAGVGAFVLFRFADEIHRSYLSTLVRIAGALFAVFIMLEHWVYNVGLFPYNYVYVNPLATWGKEPDDTWETDYWGLSVREALSEIPEGIPIEVWGVSASYEPFAHIRQRGADRQVEPPQFYWLKTQRNDFGVPQPGDCTIASRIQRTVLFKEFTMARIYRCAARDSNPQPAD